MFHLHTRGQRGVSTVGIALAIGTIVISIGVFVLFSTDSQIRLVKLNLQERDSDWTMRAAIRLTEEAWRRYLAVTETQPFVFNGTVFNDIATFSREEALIWVQQQVNLTGNANFSLLPLFIERNDRDIATNGTDQIPASYVFQVDLNDLTNPNLDENPNEVADGIVAVDEEAVLNNNIAPIWNFIDNLRSFNAIITVQPNGLVRNSPDGAFRVFPVRYTIDLTVRSPGPRNDVITRTVTGQGSADIYMGRRAFNQFIMYCDLFKMRDEGQIWFPNGFTYDGPVHTNGEFAFMDRTSTHFTDRVTSVSRTALYYPNEHLDADHSSTVYPIFDKKFYRGVSPIPPPQDLVDIKAGVLADNSEPPDPGVYLVTKGGLNNGTGGGELKTGGIYVKGDVVSLKLEQGDRIQTYKIEHAVPAGQSSPPTITYYKSTGDTTTKESLAVKKVVEVTIPVAVTSYTITCNYATNTTSVTKATGTVIRNQTKKTVYVRSSTSDPWPQTPSETYVWYSSATGSYSSTVTYQYSGVVDAVANYDDSGDPTQNRKQPAIYVDGALGGLSEHSYYNSKSPTGLSGTVDKETELTICAKYPVVVSGDTVYEEDPRQVMTTRNILGILSEYDNVYVDYPNPVGTPVNIQASIMTPNGQFQAWDYRLWLNKPKINILGGVVQKWYGPVATGDNGYVRNFVYDRRFTTLAPPFYPRQNAMGMRTTTGEGLETFQLVWNYHDIEGVADGH